MGTLTIIVYAVIVVALLFFAYLNVKYFMNMWDFKYRKKDGSEDHLFKTFD
jgi:hypothetical protein